MKGRADTCCDGPAKNRKRQHIITNKNGIKRYRNKEFNDKSTKGAKKSRTKFTKKNRSNMSIKSKPKKVKFSKSSIKIKIETNPKLISNTLKPKDTSLLSTSQTISTSIPKKSSNYKNNKFEFKFPKSMLGERNAIISTVDFEDVMIDSDIITDEINTKQEQKLPFVAFGELVQTYSMNTNNLPPLIPSLIFNNNMNISYALQTFMSYNQEETKATPSSIHSIATNYTGRNSNSKHVQISNNLIGDNNYRHVCPPITNYNVPMNNNNNQATLGDIINGTNMIANNHENINSVYKTDEDENEFSLLNNQQNSIINPKPPANEQNSNRNQKLPIYNTFIVDNSHNENVNHSGMNIDGQQSTTGNQDLVMFRGVTEQEQEQEQEMTQHPSFVNDNDNESDNRSQYNLPLITDSPDSILVAAQYRHLEDTKDIDHDININFDVDITPLNLHDGLRGFDMNNNSTLFSNNFSI